MSVALMLTIWLVDQLTKLWAVRTLSDGRTIAVIGDVWTFRLFYNPGAAFSFAPNATVIFSILSIVVLVCVLVLWLPRLTDWLSTVVAGLLAGGVAGNLTDRIFGDPAPLRGHVIDFISLKWFAVFNVADIAITSAAVLMIVWALIPERSAKKTDSASEATYAEQDDPV